MAARLGWKNADASEQGGQQRNFLMYRLQILREQFAYRRVISRVECPRTFEDGTAIPRA
jgi:hypothetical protein